MAKLKTQSALPWYGSDAMVAEGIAALLDGCEHVTIPFCGGLGILPHLKARAVLANDLHLRAINFYRVLKHPDLSAKLIARCQSTLCHPEELAEALAVVCEPLTPHVGAAWAYWSRCWLGRKGQGGTPQVGQSASIRRGAGGGTNATRLAAAAGDLPAWAELFKRVEFLCQHFLHVLTKVRDERRNAVYADPPWVAEGLAYEHSFSEQDHRQLAGLLGGLRRAVVVVRIGDHPLIRELYPEDQWTWIEASSRTQSNCIRGEYWITNDGPRGPIEASSTGPQHWGAVYQPHGERKDGTST